MEGLTDILSVIASKFGLQWTGIGIAAASIIGITNFFKATQPFAKWVNNSTNLYVVWGLSLVTALFNYWGHWTQVAVATPLMAVSAIAGWSTIKMAAHKMGTPASNASGGAKETPPTP